MESYVVFYMYHRCFVYGYVTAVDTIMPGLDRYPSMTGWKRDSDTGHEALCPVSTSEFCSYEMNFKQCYLHASQRI
eukprot:COSAG02_NODE_194_length_29788_cov_20.044090_12_plen_76_part_00